MIKIKNTLEYNELRRQLLGGNITSIWKDNTFFKGCRSYPLVSFHHITSEFSNFEKTIFEQEFKMIYHLSGYGMNYNEALVSYLGESSERYTFASFYSMIEKYVIKASYKKLVQKFGEKSVCNLKYINIYFKAKDKDHFIEEEDELQWIRMNSLINIGNYIYIPLQFVVSDNGIIFNNEKIFMPSAVSTGTASQESVTKSLTNAIIEYLQIDSFNLWWYGGFRGNEIDISLESFLRLICLNNTEIRDCIENFDFKFTDISFDKQIFVVVCEAFGKKNNLPLYTVGVQGGLERKKAIYRAFMECIAVVEYNMNLPWMDEKKYKDIQKNKIEINNLDDNVILYSKFGKPEFIKHNKIFVENKIFNTKKRFDLSKLSKYASFLTITLPDFTNMNMEIVRVCIPELLSLCLPSYPPYIHPRYKELGGIRNNVPHPLA